MSKISRVILHGDLYRLDCGLVDVLQDLVDINVCIVDCGEVLGVDAATAVRPVACEEDALLGLIVVCSIGKYRVLLARGMLVPGEMRR